MMVPRKPQVVYAVAGFISPLAIILILNAGLIFEFPNLLGLFETQTNYLATPRTNSGATDVLVGVAGMFVVFFVFVQLAYSLRHVPDWFTTEYLIQHEHTYGFVAYFLSLLAILGYFSIDESIRRVNQAYLSFSILSSVVLIIIYFIAFANKISVRGMLQCIISRFSFKALDSLEQELAMNSSRFEESLERNPNIKRVHDFPSFILLPRLQAVVKSSGRGIVESINIVKLKRLLRPISSKLQEIELYISIGDWSPSRNDILLRFVPVEGAFEEVYDFVSKNHDKLESCITLASVEYESLRKPLRDLLRVYEHVAEYSPRELKTVVNKLSKFLVDTRWH